MEQLLESFKKGIDYIGVAAGGMIFNSEGKVLLAKRGPDARNEAGLWEFSGGAIEFGETLEAGFAREAGEEFDITIEVIELLDVVSHILPAENQHWVSPTFLAKHIAGEPKVLEPGKIDEVKWITLQEIADYKLSIVSQASLRSYVDRYGQAAPSF
jgi:mutator protein MutT